MSQVFAWLHNEWRNIVSLCRIAEFQLRVYTVDALEHLLIFLIIYIVICIIIYLLVVEWKCLEFISPIKNPKRILFITAHPDDECMFFGPTILQFTKRKDCTVYLLCLSTGKNYGMGQIRKRELYEACKELGIEEDRIFIQNHTLLPDSMTCRWPADILGPMILNQVEMYDIDTLITFDKHGVSKHLNHCSIYYALANIVMTGKLPNSCNIYVLESINVIRKYWLILDLPICYLLSRIRYISLREDRKRIYNAMTKHKSQLVWFRKLYMWSSRYILLNTLQKMDTLDIELDLNE